MAEAAAHCWHRYWGQNVFAKALRAEGATLYSWMVGFFATEQTCVEKASFMLSLSLPVP